MEKCDPFLSLDCARVEGVGGAIQEKEKDQILQRSIAELKSRSPKGQTHTIKKSGYSHLATMVLDAHMAMGRQAGDPPLRNGVFQCPFAIASIS